MNLFKILEVKQYLRWIAIIGLTVYLIISLVSYLLYPTTDLMRRWREAGYVIHGIDPIEAARNGEPVLPEYGGLWDTDGYPPWSYFYAFFLAPPWLPLEVVKIYFLLFNILAIGSMIIPVKRAAEQFGCKEEWKFLYFAVLCSSAIPQGWRFGQYGVLVTAFLWWFLYFESRNLSLPAGIFLALSCLKPQIGALFILLPLVKRSYHTFLYAGLARLLATGTVSWLCSTSPFELLKESSATGNLNQFYTGIADPLKAMIRKSDLQLITISISLCAVLYLLIRYRRLSVFELAAVPAVFATIWMSHRVHDLLVISLLVLPLLCLAFKNSGWNLNLIALLVAFSHWLPHLNRVYQIPPIPFAYRVLWLVGVILLLRETSRQATPAESTAEGVALA